MKTYILFIFGMFEDFEDIEYFCIQVLSDNPLFKSIRFVIEREQNVIAIFDSEIDEKQLSDELYSVLINDNIKFYFIFERDNLISGNLPKEVKDFMFKPNMEKNIVKLEYEKVKNLTNMDLDQVLDKIKELGIDSLTTEEKKFLDNFEK